MKHSKFVAIALAMMMLTAVMSTGAWAAYPDKSITMIIPYGAGGGTDVIGRKLSEIAAMRLGQPVIVVNKPGGNSVPGMIEVMNARPDGYTLIFAGPPIASLKASGLADITVDDFAPIAVGNADPPAITVRADSPWETIEDFVKDVEGRPGEISIGVSAQQGIWYVAARLVEIESGLDLNLVPFQSGATAGITALLGGHIDAVGVSPGEVYEHVRAGNLRILAIGSDDRLERFPNVPTYEEAGLVSELQAVSAMRVFLAPKDTPEDILLALEDAFVSAGDSPEFLKFMDDNVFATLTLGRKDGLRFVKKQAEAYEQIYKQF